MPSHLKRPSLVRLLASLCPPPSRKSSFPVQTGFPTSLADLVVRNHGRLRKPRKPRRPAGAALAPPACPVVTVDELPLTPRLPAQPLSQMAVRRLDATAQPLSPVALRRLDATSRLPEGATVFRLRPELLAAGGAVALALLAVLGERAVAALTVAALSLLWIESASRRSRSRPCPAESVALLDSCGRGPVSPIREAEESPRCSSSDSDKGSEPSSPRTDGRCELVAAAGGGGDEPSTPKRKGSKRSLRKIISKKLQKKPKPKDSSSSCDGEAEHPEAAAVGDADPVLKTESLVTSSESSIEEWSSSSESALLAVDRRGPGVKFPLSAFVPVILAGLAAGRLPATALAVLCVALFSGAVQRL